MYCPQCGTYFEKNITLCPVCENRLVENSKSADPETPEDMEQMDITEKVFEEIAEKIGDIAEGEDQEKKAEKWGGVSRLGARKISLLGILAVLVLLTFFLAYKFYQKPQKETVEEVKLTEVEEKFFAGMEPEAKKEKKVEEPLPGTEEKKMASRKKKALKEPSPEIETGTLSPKMEKAEEKESVPTVGNLKDAQEYERGKKAVRKNIFIPKEPAPKKSIAPKSASRKKPSIASFRYTVVVGSYKNKKNAENMAKKLIKSGYPAFRSTVEIPQKGIWHRVKVGRFNSKKNADKFARQFKKKEKLAVFVLKERGGK